jgi:hypothetical protein
MAGYCTLDDVQALLPWPLPETSTNPTSVTQSTVTDDIIPEVCRYIDDRLAQYYVTPITGEKALVTINRVARYLAAASVVERKYVGQTPSDSPQAQTYRKQAEDDLTRIVEGKIILYDAQPAADTPESRTHQVGDRLSSPLAPRPHFRTRMRF